MYYTFILRTNCNQEVYFSGYTPLKDRDWDIALSESYSTKNCGRWTQNTDARTNPGNSETGGTLVLHEAWTVYWNKSDTSTLTPQLLTLTNNMNVPTWTPVDEIPDGKWDRTPPDD